ncbi:integrase catalytic domain-containing protein [Trichonephila clavipes]|nr:integrase catalytic domain-containing protein [Trichonephila clavipes]
MEILSEEVEGALTVLKIKGDTVMASVPPTIALHNKTFPNEITTYRFTHLPFGLACSPFLLCTVTRELASKHMKVFPTAALMMDKYLYMDDFVASVETEPQIITLHRELTDLMLLIKILMHKWATNSLMLQNLLRTQGKEFETIVKILEME